MKASNELKNKLLETFQYNKCRIDCLVNLIVALFMVKTVNLWELASCFVGEAKQESHYKRIQRFFRELKWNDSWYAKWSLSLFFPESKRIKLSMDRTNWQFGKVGLNFLVLSAVYRGIAVPLFWEALPKKKGNSSPEERIAILKRFIDCFSKERIDCVLADREFIGKKWFAWLFEQDISFHIRVKHNLITTNARGLEVYIHGLFYSLCCGEKLVLPKSRKLYGQQVYLTGARSKGGDLWIIASLNQTEEAVENYRQRWQIETLFGCLKSKGFCFEETHMTKKERIEKLFAVLSMAFCWAHKVGELRHQEEKPILVKKHGRKQFSFFRYGFDMIRKILFHLQEKTKQFMKSLEALSTPYCFSLHEETI
jgi:hypothetical protein